MNKWVWIMTILTLSFLMATPAMGEEQDKFSREELLELSENFFQYLSAGEYDLAEELFAPEVQEMLPEGALKEMWENLTSDLGPLEEAKDYRVTMEGGYQMVYARCEFEKAEFKAKLAFSTEGKIIGFQLLLLLRLSILRQITWKKIKL